MQVDFDIQMGNVEGLAEYIRRNEGWVHPVAGETILQLLDGTHRTHRLKWRRSPKLNPKQMPLRETVKRDYELAKEVARKGGFRRGMYARVCHEVGQNQSPKMSGKTVEKLVRPHRKDQRFADLTKYLEQRARRK
ncbi:hypothetical protein [Aurantiacibacter luteus]|uniref:hypothetical protein n=1 Tax=Aurantiacibacter luteus TaxID=1581420 RepID=UPI0019D3EE3C|nr:hypothetical protein [Aurantiacibacter luteus]